MSAPLMTPAQVAALFKVDVRTVARWGKAGRLLEARTPGGHRRLFPAEVGALLRGEEPEAARKLGIEQRDRIAGEAHGG